MRLHSGAVYSVGDLAALAHVSVRTLHHYDELGLLRPSARTAAGHRRYGEADLGRLREILVYRELDFGLDEIAAMLADRARGTDDHLRRQHQMLRERIARDQRLLRALEREMESRKMGTSLTPEEQFEVFGTDKVGGEWHDEAEQRWGETEAFQESQRRAASYTKEDWVALKAESDAGLRAYADAMRSGIPATSPEAMALAEANRAFISRWFYECSHEMQRGLAEMYVTDERFGKPYDDVAPGLAQYVHDAILANCAAHESSG